MKTLIKIALAGCLILALGGAAGAVGAADFSQRTDGWYAPPKLAAAVLDYSVDWTAWLAGDSIASSTWAPVTGLTEGGDSLDTAKKIATIWLSGGTVGQKYTLTNTITTAAGRTNLVSFKLEVK